MAKVEMTSQEKKRLMEIALNQASRFFTNRILKVDPDYYKVRRRRPCSGMTGDKGSMIPS